MGDFFMNDSLQNDSYDQGNISNDNTDYGYTEFKKILSIWHVASCIVISIGLLITFFAIIYVYRMVRRDSVAPIFIINILISDLIQLCCLLLLEASHFNWDLFLILYCTHRTATAATVGFIMCLSLERYLAIAHPLWYRCKQSYKTSVVVSVVIWASSIFSFLSFSFFIYLIPCVLLLILFLVLTLRALCTSVSVPSDEKRTIAGILILVPLYISLSLSCELVFRKIDFSIAICVLADIFLKLRPLTDLVLFVFIRKETISKLLSCKCCCRLKSNDNIMAANNGAVAP